MDRDSEAISSFTGTTYSNDHNDDAPVPTPPMYIINALGLFRFKTVEYVFFSFACRLRNLLYRIENSVFYCMVHVKVQNQIINKLKSTKCLVKYRYTSIKEMGNAINQTNACICKKSKYFLLVYDAIVCKLGLTGIPR